MKITIDTDEGYIEIVKENPPIRILLTESWQDIRLHDSIDAFVVDLSRQVVDRVGHILPQKD